MGLFFLSLATFAQLRTPFPFVLSSPRIPILQVRRPNLSPRIYGSVPRFLCGRRTSREWFSGDVPASGYSHALPFLALLSACSPFPVFLAPLSRRPSLSFSPFGGRCALMFVRLRLRRLDDGGKACFKFVFLTSSEALRDCRVWLVLSYMVVADPTIAMIQTCLFFPPRLFWGVDRGAQFFLVLAVL